jgi:hypothetical protein
MDMTIKINPVHLAAARFRIADNDWNKELIRLFRREACNARYEKRGRGEYEEIKRRAWCIAPGELRRLFERIMRWWKDKGPKK